MVYRGKPSAGCEACRKAKKRCGLEQPACLRCVKLKRTCSGYRDTTSLQIQDESEAVKRKAERRREKTQPESQSQSPVPYQSQSQHLEPHKTGFTGGMPTPASITSDSTTSSESTVELADPYPTNPESDGFGTNESTHSDKGHQNAALTVFLRPKPDDVATTYFFNNFTSGTHWSYMQMFASRVSMDPCLELAIKACGMAALDNVQSVVMGKEYARSMYVRALGIINEALRDPTRSIMDQSLIAVEMLARYENLTCEGKQSIQSWKAHIQGATQLLKLRGKAQLRTPIGRILFRETRYQILTSCLMDDDLPPEFLWEYQVELRKYEVNLQATQPMDDMTFLCFEFARLRYNLRVGDISDAQAIEAASDLERRFIQWQINTITHKEDWRYYEIEVEDSEHVWDGKVHAYTGHPAPQVWNLWRSMRIMLSRSQEMLCQKFQFAESERDEQMRYFRKIRRQMTDEICATIPVALGHASPAYSSPCVLITAYASGKFCHLTPCAAYYRSERNTCRLLANIVAVWPVFFACSVALERVGLGAWSILMGEGLPPDLTHNAAAAQALWLMGRLKYISKSVGLRWADGVLSALRGEFMVPEELLLQ